MNIGNTTEYGTPYGKALSSNMIKKITSHIIANDTYQYPTAGMGLIELTSPFLNKKGINSTDGVMAVNIVPGGPAQEIGLRSAPNSPSGQYFFDAKGGDIILKVDTETVRNFDDFHNYIQQYKSVGDTINLTILRDGLQMSNFSMILDSTANVYNKTTSEQRTLEKETVKELTSNEFVDRQGNIHTIGEIQNISPDKTLTSIQVIVSFYDTQGKIIGTDFTYTQPSILEPGKTATYEIITYPADMANSNFVTKKVVYQWNES
jgi:hypothetical protein